MSEEAYFLPADMLTDIGFEYQSFNEWGNKMFMKNYEEAKVEDGVLADVAPSILHILGLPQPAEMDGKDLIK